MRFSNKRPAFTIVELLVSMAIIGILTAVFISGLNQQRFVSLARRTAEKISTDIQAMQNSALSGQAITGVRPNGYGAYFNLATKGVYRTFGDGTPIDNKLTLSPPDYLIQTVTLDKTMTVSKLEISGKDSGGVQVTDALTGQLNIVYSVPGGTVSTVAIPAPSRAVPPYAQAAITVKNSKQNVCYAVTVDLATGTVSARSTTSCT